MSSTPPCRFCSAPLTHTVVDLGMSPLANSYLGPEDLRAMEPFFPLRLWVCGACLLVQLEAAENPETIFGEYAYFSSYSTTWLEHAKRYATATVERFGLGPDHLVVEVASNDGYLLKCFRDLGIPVLGVEPAANVAEVALEKGIPTVVEFFGRGSAAGLVAKSPADLLIGNNVLAHVPDLNDFVAGLKILLKPGGVLTMEFPHLARLIEANQFDTIYHEHFSYFSFLAVRRVFAAHGLRLFDVDELSTHGGSLRIYGCHAENDAMTDHPRTEALLDTERAMGLDDLQTYAAYGRRVEADKRAILRLMIALKQEGATIVGYGAPAKGNTLLNYCGIRTDFLDYTVDLSPHKQGRYLPGVRIPIRAPEAIAETRPDYVLILPWNLREEITEQLAFIREWGGQFIVRAPELTVFQ